MHFELGLPVLQAVRDFVGAVREFARLAHGDEAGVQASRERAAENEAARFDSDDRVDLFADEAVSNGVEDDVEAFGVREKWGDVAEEDAGGREIRDVADEA